MVSLSRVATRVHRSEGSVKTILSTASSSTRFLSVVVWGEEDTVSRLPGDMPTGVEGGSDGEGLWYSCSQISIAPPECPGSWSARAVGLVRTTIHSRRGSVGS